MEGRSQEDEPMFRKGATISTFKPLRIAPLFLDERELNFSKLPLYNETENAVCMKLGISDDVQQQVQELTRKDFPRPIHEALVFSLVLVDVGISSDIVKGDHETGGVLEHKKLIRKTWDAVNNRIEFDSWCQLVKFVYQTMHIVHRDHPLVTYSKHQLSGLTTLEVQEVRDLLGISVADTSHLALMEHIQSHFKSQRYAILLDDFDYPHSCLPTAQLEMLPGGDVSLVALRDTDMVSVCHVIDSDCVEHREEEVSTRMGHSCGCVRCLYEADPDRALSSEHATQLGHFYMSRGRLDEAQKLYKDALRTRRDDADVLHALGAVELSLGKFLSAQRMWKAAVDNYPETCAVHKELASQMEKIKSYRYFSSKVNNSTPMIKTAWQSPFTDVFVTDLLDGEACRQVIAWAESGSWTQERHYAVPTYDIPVHTLRPLLDWFNDWMQKRICPLLAQQFGTTSNYYVHDAFIVKYAATDQSNHLPVHTDESSHSLVLALNDDYEGGGTYFSEPNRVLRLRAGELLSFRGDHIRHGGEAVTRGVRYILAVFLYHDHIETTGKREASNGIMEVVRESKQTKFSFGFEVEE